MNSSLLSSYLSTYLLSSFLFTYLSIYLSTFCHGTFIASNLMKLRWRVRAFLDRLVGILGGLSQSGSVVELGAV